MKVSPNNEVLHNLLKMLMPFYLEVAQPSYKTRSGETCYVVMFTSINVEDENNVANTHIDPSQVGQKIPLFTIRVKKKKTTNFSVVNKIYIVSLLP